MNTTFSKLTRKLQTKASSEDGAMTAFGLLMFVSSCALGGIALDMSNALQVRTQLQVAADSAAHAALVERQSGGTEPEAIVAALAVVERALPSEVYGNTLLPEDIVFGLWDQGTRTFTPSIGADDAVMVDTSRLVGRGNRVRAFLLRFAGVPGFDVVRRSIADTYVPTCMLEGFVGDQYVDVTSNNLYTSGFCIHSNGYVALNSNNIYEPGVIVSMPDKRDVVLPSSGMESNDGLEESLRDGYYEINAAGRVDMMLNGIIDINSPVYPDYLTSPLPVTVEWKGQLDETVWQEGRIHQITCPNTNQSISIPTSTVLREGVLITNCKVAFGSGAAAEDVTIITTSTAEASITGASGIRMGRKDDCAPGGGAQFFSLGGFRAPAGMEMNGSRIVAAGSVSFAADVGSINGASVISDQHINATASGRIGFCGPDGLPIWYEPEFFRIVQ
ncbi:Putative Flp pilus-assembly TadE/G-like [Jannaschia faecimaris]|uniref:Putative Flp pilus-assembly TadE/G-like n=1 Tax=Jannaschia faecimaris TaxID=1244108 RepID=A0A1H3KYR4_9RHOB|nr:pilus assembly protein TadG-related protein [Jannaschia faecimaris]SDY57303.1 Putative Flp pilus-assembly TadE/G-like [Jannaschia faecimaris]